MKEELVPFKLALKLRERGFDCFVRYYYKTSGAHKKKAFHHPSHRENFNYGGCGDAISAPQIHEVLKWLRDKHNILVSPSVYGNEDGRKWNYAIVNIETFELLNPVLTSNLVSFEQAALAGIEYVIDNLI